MHLPPWISRTASLFAIRRSVAVISVNPELAAIAMVICAFARQRSRRRRAVERNCGVALPYAIMRATYRKTLRRCAPHASSNEKITDNNMRESEMYVYTCVRKEPLASASRRRLRDIIAGVHLLFARINAAR